MGGPKLLMISRRDSSDIYRSICEHETLILAYAFRRVKESAIQIKEIMQPKSLDIQNPRNVPSGKKALEELQRYIMLTFEA